MNDECSPVLQVINGQKPHVEDRIGSGCDSVETSSWIINADKDGMDKQVSERTARNSQEIGDVTLFRGEDKTFSSFGV